MQTMSLIENQQLKINALILRFRVKFAPYVMGRNPKELALQIGRLPVTNVMAEQTVQ